MDCDLCPEEYRQVIGYEIPKSKRILAQMRALSYHFIPMGRKKLRVKTVMNIDQKINFIPEGVMQWAMKKMAKEMLTFMVEKSGKLEGTPWEKLREDPKKAHFYDWIHQRTDWFADKMGWE